MPETNRTLVDSLLYLAAKNALCAIESGRIRETLVESYVVETLSNAIAIADEYRDKTREEVIETPVKLSGDVLDDEGNVCNDF